MSELIRITINLLDQEKGRTELTTYRVKIKDLALPRLTEGIQLSKGSTVYYLHVVDVVHVKRVSSPDSSEDVLEDYEIFINTVPAP